MIDNSMEGDNSLTDAFNTAAFRLQHLHSELESDTLLQLYAYYKQGTIGPCALSKPRWYNYKAIAKWKAWQCLGDMTKTEAQTLYIELVRKIDPSFSETATHLTQTRGITVSKFQMEEDPEVVLTDTDPLKNHVKDGNTETVQTMLRNDCNLVRQINQIESATGMALVHWAADRGSVTMLQVLLEFDADVNLQDSNGQTALHYAASCGHLDCIRLLLSKNANFKIADNSGCIALDVADNDVVKELLHNM